MLCAFPMLPAPVDFRSTNQILQQIVEAIFDKKVIEIEQLAKILVGRFSAGFLSDNFQGSILFLQIFAEQMVRDIGIFNNTNLLTISYDGSEDQSITRVYAQHASYGIDSLYCVIKQDSARECYFYNANGDFLFSLQSLYTHMHNREDLRLLILQRMVNLLEDINSELKPKAEVFNREATRSRETKLERFLKFVFPSLYPEKSYTQRAQH